MKTIWRRLVYLLLVLILAAGTTLTLSGCRRQGPLERAGERADEAVEETGEALEETGEAVRGDR
jgi:predicted small lipoprotein YifL